MNSDMYSADYQGEQLTYTSVSLENQASRVAKMLFDLVRARDGVIWSRPIHADPLINIPV